MAERGEFRFEIADLTPLTLSLERLCEYLPHLVTIFGNRPHVHLTRVDDGSAVPCVSVDDRYVKRVSQRLLAIKQGHGGRLAHRAIESLNDLLAEDGTSAELKAPNFGLVIEFPGARRAIEPAVGPLSEYADVQGELFQIGGRDETISLYLKDEQRVFICMATREQGRDISRYLFRTVRVLGTGTWIRSESGKWKLVQLRVDRFFPLETASLSKSVEALRALTREIPGDRVALDADT